MAVITSNFSPEPTGISQTVTEFAMFLAQAGLPVVVATAFPYYPHWRIAPEYRGRARSTERRGPVTVLRSWHLIRPNPSTLTRMLHELSLCVAGCANVVRALWGAQAAYVVTPDLTFALLGLVIARALRVRSTLVVKDVMPDAAVELGMLRNPVAIWLSRRMARWAYGLANQIHTLGEGMRRRIAQSTADVSKIHIVPDTIDAVELAPVPAEGNEFRRQFVRPGMFAVLHTGNMGRKQDLLLILKTARRMAADPLIHFFVFGEGAAKQEFLKTRTAWGLDNVSHYPLQERSMVRHMLGGADVVLVSQLPEVVDIVLPSKLITALGAGAMVVAACDANSETARVVRASGGGVVVPPSDDAALADVIARIRTGAVDVSACRARGRAYALEHFDRGAVYGPILQSHLHSNLAAGSAALMAPTR